MIKNEFKYNIYKTPMFVFFHETQDFILLKPITVVRKKIIISTLPGNLLKTVYDGRDFELRRAKIVDKDYKIQAFENRTRSKFYAYQSDSDNRIYVSKTEITKNPTRFYAEEINTGNVFLFDRVNKFSQKFTFIADGRAIRAIEIDGEMPVKTVYPVNMRDNNYIKSEQEIKMHKAWMARANSKFAVYFDIIGRKYVLTFVH